MAKHDGPFFYGKKACQKLFTKNKDFWGESSLALSSMIIYVAESWTLPWHLKSLAQISAADCAWAPFLERYAAQLPLLHKGLHPYETQLHFMWALTAGIFTAVGVKIMVVYVKKGHFTAMRFLVFRWKTIGDCRCICHTQRQNDTPKSVRNMKKDIFLGHVKNLGKQWRTA